MRILGIETSCDETAAGVVENGKVLSNMVSSQLELHEKFRGIVPELAARAHLQKISEIIERAWRESGGRALDAIGYTQGPGLMGPLLVGKVAAQTLAKIVGCPLVAVNHLEGHVFAVELSETIAFPLVALIVSGGHTDLVLCRAPGRYRVLGRTRDDAAGEAFDKVARMLGLGYPGGPVVDRLAQDGDPAAVRLPRPTMPESWDFSFAGLKTAVLYHLERAVPRSRRRAGAGGQPQFVLPKGELADLCASFQEAVAETLVTKTMWAAEHFGVREVVLGGGVAANSRLRELAQRRGLEKGIRVLLPPKALCTDNGVMIAQAAAHRLRAGRLSRSLRCDPALPFQNWARGL